MRSFLCYFLLVATFAAYAQSGTTGNLTWSIKDSTLTISGNGAMPDYEYGMQLWASHPTTIVIENGVTSIGEWTFVDYYSLTSVIIPNSVTSIGKGAFYNCRGLISIYVDENNTAYTSENGVLFNKTKSVLIQYPAGKKDTNYNIPNSVISIGDYAFSYCSSLTSVIIPNSVTYIGIVAFENCKGLMSVAIPNPVTFIGGGAFDGCGNLKSITIPNLVTSIESSTFFGCSSLTSVTIPNSVKSIGNNAFSECSNLASVIIGGSVTSIESMAFLGCNGLTEIINYAATPQTIEHNVFDYWDKYLDKTKCTLRVLLPFITAYRAAEVWKEFGSIEPIIK